MSAEAAPYLDEKFIKEIQAPLQKFAELQLGDSQLAEDAVQETLIGAMRNAKSFEGRSAFKTWMFAILKNKIADILRKRHRTVEVTNLGSDEDGMDLDDLFNESGHWRDIHQPQAWADPEGSFRQDQFWQVLESCLNHLPERQAKVFMMREFLGLETDAICEQEGISVSNLHVLLYRARARLQLCLESNWFGESNA